MSIYGSHFPGLDQFNALHLNLLSVTTILPHFELFDNCSEFTNSIRRNSDPQQEFR